MTQYINNLEATGFTNEVSESQTAYNIYYGAKNSSGTHLSLSYSDDSMTIALDTTI